MRAWWPVAAWGVLILLATSLAVPDAGLLRFRFPVDKVVHFAMYLGLGWSVGRALWISGRRTTRAVLVALAAGLAFAALTELQQALLHWRHASFADWLADAGGMCVGLAVYLWPRWHAVRREGDERRGAAFPLEG